jgi:serine/threonine protein kinase
MIMEAAMGGELYHYLKKHECMPEPIAREVILQVIHAMLYCHSRGVVHRDLKLENVLFKNKAEDDFLVKVVDFGIAGVADEKVDAGTLSYMAPECLEKVAADTTPAIDVWAIGIMFYAMVYGTLPFMGDTERDTIKAIKSDNLKYPKTHPITPEGKELLKSMLQKDPTKRVELLEFVSCPYNIMD